MTDSILFPVADHAGTLVWASDLAVDGERPTALSCLACGGALLLRAGERNRPHFAHRSADACTAGETALHAATCRILADAISSAARVGTTFSITSACRSCRASRTGNLAPPGVELTLDRVLADGIRPDLFARVRGRELYVIEVVVTHAPEPAALDLYASRDLSVVVVRPTWDTLEQFRTGLHLHLLADKPGQQGRYETVSRCRFPRHADPGEVACGTCRRPARRLTAEVSTAPCWRGNCHESVRVLDLYDHTDGYPQLVAASCPDLPEAKELAATLGVTVAWRQSRQAGGAYLMHLCGGCRSTQGDNFLYAEGGASPDLSGFVQHVTVCPSGHLERSGARRWPAGSNAERIVPTGGPGHVVGLLGDPPGLFNQQSGVRVQQVAPGNVGDLVRQMMGSGWM
jgi:hypothetical protein